MLLPSDLPKGDKTLVVCRPGVSFEEIEIATGLIAGKLEWTDIRQGVSLIKHDPEVTQRNFSLTEPWL